MKLLILLFTLSLTIAASADTIQKWTDKNGIVHYGDIYSADYVERSETLKINNSFNQQSYDEGMQRHKDTIDLSDKLEKERITEEKKREAEKKPVARAPNSRQARRTVPQKIIEPNLKNPSRPVNRDRPAQLPAKQK